MFIGEYLHTIDHKKRLAIPYKFRKELGNRAVITRGLDNSLIVYPVKEWEKIAKKLESLPSSQINARNFVRIMLSGATDAGFDKLGRILVPDFLKDYAFLKRNVAILGLSNRIEIWDEKRWRIHKQKAEKQIGNMVEKLKELGI